jgi:hypothetical protein
MPIVRGMHGETSHIDDMVVERPDGTITHLEIFGSPVADAHGKIWASLVSFMDVTERKYMANETKRLNRILKMISECNQVFLHAEDEQEALNNICDIIVQL